MYGATEAKGDAIFANFAFQATGSKDVTVTTDMAKVSIHSLLSPDCKGRGYGVNLGMEDPKYFGKGDLYYSSRCVYDALFGPEANVAKKLDRFRKNLDKPGWGSICGQRFEELVKLRLRTGKDFDLHLRELDLEQELPKTREKRKAADFNMKLTYRKAEAKTEGSDSADTGGAYSYA